MGRGIFSSLSFAEANKRFGQLDDYNIMDEVTVYFANGKVALDPKYKPQLLQLAEKAKTINAYTIQIKAMHHPWAAPP